MISSKRGKLYFKFVVAAAIIAAAIIAAAIYAYSALAAVPSSTPVIVNTNGTTISSAFVSRSSEVL